MSGDTKKFVSECVKAINDCRKIHQVKSLKENPELTKLAQSWAEHLANRNMLGHSNNRYKGEPLGENCFMIGSSSGASLAPSDPVDSWYDEIKNYNFSSHSGPGTGHFTQMVWKSSSEVGIGRASSRDGTRFMVVANFFPAGNFRGQNSQNVYPPTGTRQKSRTTESERRAAPVKEPDSSGFFSKFFKREEKRRDWDGSGGQMSISRPDGMRATVALPITVTSANDGKTRYHKEVSSDPYGGKTVTTTYTHESMAGPGGTTRTVTSQQVTSKTRTTYERRTFNSQW